MLDLKIKFILLSIVYFNRKMFTPKDIIISNIKILAWVIFLAF